MKLVCFTNHLHCSAHLSKSDYSRHDELSLNVAAIVIGGCSFLGYSPIKANYDQHFSDITVMNFSVLHKLRPEDAYMLLLPL